MVDQGLLTTINQVLGKISPDYLLIVSLNTSHLYFQTKYNRMSARINCQGRHFHHKTYRVSCGGTVEMMVVQLIHWLRDEPRYPLWIWEIWAGPGYKACSQEVLGLLKAQGYDNKKTRCVICGKEITKIQGADWYNNIGPCHWKGKCDND
jgi:hypothetical protein